MWLWCLAGGAAWTQCKMNDVCKSVCVCVCVCKNFFKFNFPKVELELFFGKMMALSEPSIHSTTLSSCWGGLVAAVVNNSVDEHSKIM